MQKSTKQQKDDRRANRYENCRLAFSAEISQHIYVSLRRSLIDDRARWRSAWLCSLRNHWGDLN